MKEIHTIPVPRGYTPEQAFDEMETFGCLVDYRWWRPRFRWPFVRWANIEIDRDD